MLPVWLSLAISAALASVPFIISDSGHGRKVASAQAKHGLS